MRGTMDLWEEEDMSMTVARLSLRSQNVIIAYEDRQTDTLNI
jgi:hypothetical protein